MNDPDSTPPPDPPAADGDAAYKQRMERRKAIQEKRIAETVGEQGLVIVHTGAGKGKTTAALGMVLRSLGHGHRVAIVQFIKGSWEPAEKRAFEPWAIRSSSTPPVVASLGRRRTGFATGRWRRRDGKSRWVTWLTRHSSSCCSMRSTSRCARTMSVSSKCSMESSGDLQHSCGPHRAQCSGRNHRARRSRHGDDADQTSAEAQEGSRAGGNRILNRFASVDC